VRPEAKPAFVPGKVTYPGQVSRPAPRPKTPPRPNHPAHFANRPQPRPLNQVIGNSNVGSNNQVINNQVINNQVTNINNINNINNVNSNNRVTNVNHNWGNQWTNNRTTVWNNTRVVNNRPVIINQNFSSSVNYAYRPAAWGARPWWSNSTYHSWHHGSWNYGWNNNWQTYHRPYYRPPGAYLPGYQVNYYDNGNHFGAAAAWGIAAWSLGRLAFDSGYNTYRNPYQAPPVQTQRTVINYTMPMSVVASKEVPEPEDAALTSEEKSTAAIERARGQFSAGDYLSALKSTDESISYAAGDSALHEFRALCLFALGRFGDAAGVLNPVLASGPGWDWSTMAAFYRDSETYAGQLRKLESYVGANPKSADSQFLLGYHYMVAGFIDQAYVMFDRVVELQPADSVAVQLRNLAESSSPEAETRTPSPENPAVAAPPPGVTVEPVDPSDIEGGWKAASADAKAITLSLGADGKFSWNYEGSGGTVLSGDWSIDEEGQLVLATDDVQMVADISLNGDTLKFVLQGAPLGDPGLSFQRQ
jgi:tetratricopeptide (TPR) repeat protein